MKTKTQPKINLTPFVSDPDSPRPYRYLRPWVSKGWRYATDGHICVRVRAKDVKDDEGSHPNAAVLFRRAKGKWLPFPQYSGAGNKQIDNRLIAGEYMTKISNLPNVKYLDDATPRKPLRFRFTGGEGAVMAMDEENA